MCPVPVDPLNGSVVWTDRSVNSLATYTCTSGFELIGHEIRFCQSDGVWSEEAPTCKGKLNAMLKQCYKFHLQALLTLGAHAQRGLR